MSINNLPSGLSATNLQNPQAQIPQASLGATSGTSGIMAAPSDGFSTTNQFNPQGGSNAMNGQGILGMILQIMQSMMGLSSSLLGGQQQAAQSGTPGQQAQSGSAPQTNSAPQSFPNCIQR